MSDEYSSPPEIPPETGSQRSVSGPSTHRSEIDPALRDLALANFREILKGNGIKPELAKITKFSGETLEFLSILKLELKSKVSTRRQAGKALATLVVAGPQELQTAIEKEQFKITHSQDVITRIKDVVLERRDIGIGLQDELLKMPFLHKDFVYYEPCTPCHGKGKMPCPRCHGKGQENCPRCQATGLEICPVCNGRQYVPGHNGQNTQCLRCNGSGKTPCRQCNQSRKIQCTGCKGKMTVKCQQCNGHAVVSVLALAEIDVEANYGYDKAIMPPNAVEKIDALGPAIREHALVNPLKLPQEVENEVMTLPYHIRLPLADLEFTIAKDAFFDPSFFPQEPEDITIPAAMFGTQGLLMAAPPFLEAVISPGLRDLEAAATKKVKIKAALLLAARYRAIKLIIVAAAQMPPKKAKTYIAKKIPVGLSETCAQKSLAHAYKALKRLTRIPAMLGYAAGAGLSAALGYFYMLEVRGPVISMIPLPSLKTLPDGAALALLMTTAYFSGKIAAKKAASMALKNLMPPSGARRE